jgi:hypothetical protein
MARQKGKPKSKPKTDGKAKSKDGKAKKAKPKRIGRLVATVEYFRDLRKPVTKAEAIKATNLIHLRSGGTDNEPEQKYSVNRIITVFTILGLLQRGKDGQLIPVRPKRS